MADNVTIRHANEDDMDVVLILVQEFVETHHVEISPKINAEVFKKDGFRSAVPAFHCILAIVDEEVIGFASYCYQYSMWKGFVAFLNCLYVKEPFRKCGIGKKLFQTVIDDSKTKGCDRINFYVMKWNDARKFYEDFGAQNMTEKEDWLGYSIEF